MDISAGTWSQVEIFSHRNFLIVTLAFGLNKSSVQALDANENHARTCPSIPEMTTPQSS